MENTQVPPPVVVYQLGSAHYVSQALYVAAELGVADLLADGPQTSEMLAAGTQTHAPSLRRVLRLLATAGVFAEDADGRFSLTPIGESLRTAPGSSRANARLFGGPSCGGPGATCPHRTDGRARARASSGPTRSGTSLSIRTRPPCSTRR